MEAAIRTIIDEVPHGCFFDSHFVINELVKRFSDEYLVFAARFSGGQQPTLAVHGQIGHEINKLNGTIIDSVGEAWSENIHKNLNRCTCWKKR
jgi:hypothetical protein